ncbi:MAG: CHAT domain-containing protein [Hyalangium sp.]|uniref:CHAT domain-containing protein n=1 Tax=Hyalangium sp. TaxID=2028555 RepID=UPI00389A1C6B
MWRAIGWMLVVGLCCAVSEAAGQESPKARQPEARPALEERSRLQQAGQPSPDVVQTLNRLGQLRLAQGQVAEAVQLFSQAFNLSEERLRREAPALSESRLTDLMRSLRRDEDRLYALLRMYPDDAGVQRLAMTSVLLRHGRSVDEAASTSRIIHRGLGPQERLAAERLQALRAQLVTLSLQGPGSLSDNDYQQRLAELAAQGDALEAALASSSASQRTRTALPLPADIVGRVAASLPRDSALIEFVAYVNRPLVPEREAPVSPDFSQLRYLALVLFPDARIRAIDLGAATDIDSAATNLSNALADKDAAYQVQSEQLYALAFQPLRPLLGDTRRLYLALDGQLSFIPFDALHDGRRSLIDAFDFTYLNSGRDLLPRPEALASSSSVVVFADPILGSVPTTHSISEAPMLAMAELPSMSTALPIQRGELADTPWLPLPGTRQEAEAIQHLYPQAQLFLGADATKERLLHLSAPAVLHLATHGYVLDGATAPEGSRGLGHVATFSGTTSAPHLRDSMLRSGLVLSDTEDSTRTSAGGKPRAAGTMVTARELVGLDLWGTELVVLSACDTGRGEVELGQGIYGLRRAFQIAGAETVVTSLWKVNDNATRLLMESYYHHLKAGEGRGEALRDAMRTLRKTHPHPHDWAAFISLGRDTPLRSLGTRP